MTKLVAKFEGFHFSCRDNSSYGVSSLGPLSNNFPSRNVLTKKKIKGPPPQQDISLLLFSGQFRRWTTVDFFCLTTTTTFLNLRKLAQSFAFLCTFAEKLSDLLIILTLEKNSKHHEILWKNRKKSEYKYIKYSEKQNKFRMDHLIKFRKLALKSFALLREIN